MSIHEIEAYESLVKEYGQEKAKLVITALQTLFAKQDYVTKDYLEESLAKLESHTNGQIADLKTELHTEIHKTKNDILKWIFGMWFSFIIFILASMFFKR